MDNHGMAAMAASLEATFYPRSNKNESFAKAMCSLAHNYSLAITSELYNQIQTGDQTRPNE